ncbi:MAG: hypothetical protein EBX39_13185, partial [Actinobacteria bacterium]|nr:hypothetical protein [Actinomycetota bacterium]
PSGLEAITSSAYQVFLSASHLTSLICLGIVTIAAILVGFGLPRIEPPKRLQPNAEPLADHS